MPNKTYSKFVLLLFFVFGKLVFHSQCVTYTSAVSDITLQCSGGSVQRSAVAFFPTHNVYYSVNRGSSSNPIETFSYTGGAALSSTLQGADYNGLWYNFNLGIIEGNTFGSASIVQHSINPVNGFALGTTSLLANAAQPSSSACGQYDWTNNQVLYYTAQTIYKYNRSTGLPVSVISITGLPATTLNSDALIYTGIAGAEVGVYDYINRRIYFINSATGAYTAACQLPFNAPAVSSAGMGFANGRLFLFDSVNLCWYGYKLSNKPEISFYGTPILCRLQEGMISVNNPYNNISTYTWSPNTFGNNAQVFIISPSPTASVIYSVAVTNTAGCINSSNYVVTAYPNILNTNIFITGIDSLFCTNLAPITLTASGQVSYNWTTGAQTSTIAVSPIVTTEYRCVGRDVLGCMSIVKMFTVTVYGNPTIAITPDDTLICAFKPVVISVSGASSYTWNALNLFTSSVSVSPNVPTLYTVTGQNTLGCLSQANSYINVASLPDLHVTGDTLICKYMYTTLSVKESNPSTYTWAPGHYGTTFIVQPITTTTYTLLANKAGCTNSTVVTVSVSECLGVEEKKEENNNVVVYPNPATGEFKISTALTGLVSAEIFNSSGQSVFRTVLNQQEYIIDLRDQPKGLYFLSIEKDGKRIAQKKIMKSS